MIVLLVCVLLQLGFVCLFVVSDRDFLLYCAGAQEERAVGAAVDGGRAKTKRCMKNLLLFDCSLFAHSADSCVLCWCFFFDFRLMKLKLLLTSKSRSPKRPSSESWS